jgi:DNA-binding GntR family transcriptional regulator
MDFEGLSTPSLQANSLGKQVYEILRDQIIQGALKPGQRLAVTNLASHLGVSVTPVRDALRRLSGDGLIEIIPRRGTFVSRCTREDVREVFQVRTVLECAAAERVSGATADLFEEMEKTVQEMSRINSLGENGRIREYRRYIDLDAEFHCCIVRLLDNRRVTEFYEQLRWPGQILRGLSYANYERATDTIVEHAAILEALRHRDISKVKAALRDHLSGAEAELLDNMPRDS